jgi:hypothetical protein
MDQSFIDSRPRLYSALFHSAWIIMLLGAAWQRFSLPLQPLAHADIWGFLNPGIQSILGHGFQHTNNRNFLYPGLIYGVLAIFKDFRAITILQHLLGLGTGVLLLVAWRQARRCLSHPNVRHWTFDLAGLSTMALYLFAAEPRHFEYLIRPDAICPFFAAVALNLVLAFLIARKIDVRPGKALLLGAMTLFVAMLIPNLKPSFWLTSVLFTIPIWMALFDPKISLVRRLLMVLVPIGAATLLMSLPERHFEATDQESKTFLPESLFSIHALIIREQLADDAAHPDPSVPYSQEKLRSTLAALDAGLAESKAKSPRHFRSLGYDADYLLYHTSFFEKMAQAEGNQWNVALGFYKYYYFRAWRKRPLEMLGKVAKQMGLFYNFKCPAYCDKNFDLQNSYSRSQRALNDSGGEKTLNEWPPAVRWQDDQAVLVTAAPTIGTNPALQIMIKLLSHAYLPALLAFLACVPLVLADQERRARFGVFCAVVAIGYGFNLGNNLGIAVLHTLDVGRYTYVQYATTIWTEMLTFVFLAELLPGVVAARRKRNESVAQGIDSPSTLVCK